MLVFTQQSNEATGVGKEPLSCDEYSDGIWHTHVRSSGTGTGKWTMTDQSMAIDDGSSTCRKKVVLQLLTAYMNLLGNIRSGRKTRWKQNSFLTWISTLSKSSFTQFLYWWWAIFFGCDSLAWPRLLQDVCPYGQKMINSVGWEPQTNLRK